MSDLYTKDAKTISSHVSNKTQDNSTNDSTTVCINVTNVLAERYSHGLSKHSVTATLIVISVSILILNGLVCRRIIMYRKLGSSKTASIFILSMAIADMLVAFTVLPFQIYRHFNDYIWELGDIMCDLSSSLDVTFCSTSILHLSCLSIDRYLAIGKPFFHRSCFTKRCTCFILIPCWLLPFAISFGFIFSGVHKIGIEESFHCSRDCTFQPNASYNLCTSIVTFYIPAFMMIAFNAMTYYQIRLDTKYLKENFHGRKSIQMRLSCREATVSRTITVMTAAFLACWMPFFVCNVATSFIRNAVDPVVMSIFLWLGYSNSAINPALYLFFDKRDYNRHSSVSERYPKVMSFKSDKTYSSKLNSDSNSNTCM